MKSKSPSGNKSTGNTNPKWLKWILGLMVVLVPLGVFVWQKKNAQSIPSSSTSTSTTSISANAPAKSETDPLIGRWVRTDSDGGYTLEIKSATTDGKLVADYFNPSLIKVGRAEWLKKDGHLIIVVELRDTNYPGSTYTLKFLPAEDRMIGNYYQAVESSNYDVAFTRVR